MYKEIPNNNCQRQALKTEIKTSPDINSVAYYSILIETSSRMSAYNVIIITFIIQLQKINRDCQIQIITFDENVNTVFKFETESILLKERLKDNNITIFGFACGDNSDEEVKDLQSLLPYQDILPLNKSPSQDDFKSLMSRINGGINISSSTKCPVNIEVYPHSAETRSIKDDILLDVVIKPIKVSDEVVIPPGTVIKFLSNSYCSGCTIILENELVVGQKYNEMFTLKSKRFNEYIESTPDFPSKIYFTIEFKNENEKVDIHEGSITLNISYFLGELKSNERCCIGVEGAIGVGKSALLNGFANLFNPTNQLEEYYIADPSSCEIATMILIFEVPLECKAEGRIHNGISMKDCNDGCSIKEPLDKFRVIASFS
ncbi:hypothetical protein ACTFIY_011574 [Dictyostelium cf. discoideum]